MRLVHSSGHRISLCDEDKISLLFPYFGTIGVDNARQSVVARPSELIVAGPGHRETHLSRHYLGMLIQVPLDVADRLDEGLVGRSSTRADWRDGIGGFTAPAASAKAHLLMETLERKDTSLDTGEAWTAAIKPLWEALSLAADDRDSAIGQPASLTQVTMAEAFMAANSAEPLSLMAVARAVNVGPRAFQLAFMRHRRLSPLQFLHRLRLDRARLRLSQPDQSRTVTEVALDTGFSHLSRFSAAYQKAFGECPSDTLRQARCP